MKKRLLLGSALLVAISAFPQQVVNDPQTKQFDMGSYLWKKFQRQLIAEESAVSTQAKTNYVQGPQLNFQSSQNASSRKQSILITPQWQLFSRSMNIYGNLVSNSKPLNFNDELNVVSFVHRKSPTYQMDDMPNDIGAISGGIVCNFTDVWGEAWDSTLLWNHADYWARYPQGGLYNPPGNTKLNQAYAVAMGPITPIQGGWTGSFFASKKLDTLGGAGNDAKITAIIGSTVYIPNTNIGAAGKFDFPRLHYTATDDGKVMTLGYLMDDVNGTTAAAQNWQGASVVRGSFNVGVFTWQADTIIPSIYTNSLGQKYVNATPGMAWNESGTVGYVWFIGVRDVRPGQGDTLSNMGFQPIVYKWTAANPQWVEMPRINFNGPGFDELWKRMLPVRNDSIGLPYFNQNEGIDGIVDRNDRLHLVSTIFNGANKHPDSLRYIYTYVNNDGETYWNRHSPGQRPFIYDFTQTGNGWNVTVIDSMSSEAPGAQSAAFGFQDNPWLGDPAQESDARIQLSRSPDGRYIVYTWAESDTTFTPAARKWNSRPNIKARMAEVGVETSTATPAALTVHSLEINVTNPASTQVPPYAELSNVKYRAYMHYVSPKCAIISPTAGAGVTLALPITVSNNTTAPKMDPAGTADHYYLSAPLNFGNVPLSSLDWPVNKIESDVGIAERSTFIDKGVLYPNPAANNAQLILELEKSVDVQVNVLNAVGQVVKSYAHQGNPGENRILLDFADMSTGIYLLKVQVGEVVGTKKLIIQR